MEVYTEIHVVFMPSDTASEDQGVVSTFKSHSLRNTLQNPVTTTDGESSDESGKINWTPYGEDLPF